MAETVTVRGTGGAVWVMDVPREGSSARERYDQQIANGDLQVVEPEPTPKAAPKSPAKPSAKS